MADIIVVGGGAAGAMAAIAAASAKASVVLLEQNEKLGKKIYITGKGRCNLTNACDRNQIFPNIQKNRKFMYSAISSFDNLQVMDFFEKEGVPLKIERGNRVFPVSDHSSDIIKGLAKALKKNKVEVLLHTKVTKIETDQEKGGFCLLDQDGKSYRSKKLILATGGLSYPSTGATGDGYSFANELGHRVTDLGPSLVAMYTKEAYIPQLQGLALRNVEARIKRGKKLLFDEFGELLFTHFGVSGPLMLTASSIVNEELQKQPLSLEIDLKPALSETQLDQRLLRDFEENKKKQLGNSLNRLLPAKMIPILIDLSGIRPEKKIYDITKEERKNLLGLLKHFPATLTGLRGFDEAIITRGGISVKEISPSTMESKIIPGLYFAGEVMDVDALTGGFNLQVAWSTGYLAGQSACEALSNDERKEEA